MGLFHATKTMPALHNLEAIYPLLSLSIPARPAHKVLQKYFQLLQLHSLVCTLHCTVMQPSPPLPASKQTKPVEGNLTENGRDQWWCQAPVNIDIFPALCFSILLIVENRSHHNTSLACTNIQHSKQSDLTGQSFLLLTIIFLLWTDQVKRDI